MPTKIDNREMLEQKKMQESNNEDNSLIDLSDQSDSEITWIKLHQMFDK